MEKRKVITLDKFADCLECSFPIHDPEAYEFDEGLTHTECGKSYGIVTHQNKIYYLVDLQYRALQPA